MQLVANGNAKIGVTRSGKGWLLTLLVGAASGLAATLTMSSAMLALKRSGFLGRMPPRLIVDGLLSAFGAKSKLPPPVRSSAAAVAHLGFGASQGALYAVLLVLARRGHTEALSKASALTAVPFALTVWAVSYAGWVPALGIMRPPSRDRRGRPTSMILSHVVFGFALADAMRDLAPRLLEHEVPARD
ncbi:MAG TPA: hypothetical protein VKP30_22790 [Polyangiaceae bacterium]|nr:hypothetical protein [Polyangiaceae bacterium]